MTLAGDRTPVLTTQGFRRGKHGANSNPAALIFYGLPVAVTSPSSRPSVPEFVYPFCHILPSAARQLCLARARLRHGRQFPPHLPPRTTISGAPPQGCALPGTCECVDFKVWLGQATLRCWASCLISASFTRFTLNSFCWEPVRRTLSSLKNKIYDNYIYIYTRPKTCYRFLFCNKALKDMAAVGLANILEDSPESVAKALRFTMAILHALGKVQLLHAFLAWFVDRETDSRFDSPSDDFTLGANFRSFSRSQICRGGRVSSTRVSKTAKPDVSARSHSAGSPFCLRTRSSPWRPALAIHQVGCKSAVRQAGVFRFSIVCSRAAPDASDCVTRFPRGSGPVSRHCTSVHRL